MNQNSSEEVLPWIMSSFNSRYGDPRIVWKTSANEYKLTGKMRYCRTGGDSKRVLYMDPEGGPFICVGDAIADLGVVSDTRYISEVKGLGTERDTMTGEELSVIGIKVSAIREKVEL